MSKSAASRLRGVSLSSVKRYARIAERGASLAPRKGGGRPPKGDQTIERLLEADIRERPAATISERFRFLWSATGKNLSLSTEAALEENGLQPKKQSVVAMERDEWLRATWRVTVAREITPEQLVFVDEMGTNISLHPLYAWSPRVRGHGALCRASVDPTPRCWRA